MTSLKETQQQFLNYLMRHENQFEDMVIGTEKFDSETRLGIYGNAYAARLVEVLEENYPVLFKLIGCKDWQALGYRYLEFSPSQHFSVRYFGHRLAEFLRQDKEYQHSPALAEIAEFEWALRAAFDAKDAESIDISQLQSIPPEQWGNMQFTLHNSVHRLNLSWNVPQLWQSIENDKTQPDPAKSEHPVSWRIWREGKLEIYFKSLAVDEAWALDAILAGNNFAQVCEGLCEWIDEQNTPQRAVELISTWITDGLIIDVTA